MSRVAAAEV
jgi:hypothetical protein